MKNIRNGMIEGLCRFCKRLRTLNMLFVLLLLYPGGIYAQSKTGQAEKATESSGIFGSAPNIAPMYMQPAPAIGDALDIRTKPRNFTSPPRIEGLEGADVQRNYAVTHAYIKSDSGKPEMKNSKFRTTAAFGQYIIADSVSHNSKTGEAGMYGFYRLPPMAPYVAATQGDYPDRVEISWRFDPLSPPANIDFFELKRDGEVIATMPATETLYKDYNTRPGQYYLYELTGKNKYGVSPAGNEVGFVNPNGTITGRIITKNGTPVRDVEVLMTPNLGKSLYLNGVNNTVSVGNKMDFRDTSFTFEFWMKHNSGDGGVFACGVVNNDVSIDMISGRMWLDVGTMYTSIAHQPDGQWHHYAWVWDNVAKQVRAYKDGENVLNTQFPANHRINISGLAAYLGKTLYSGALFNGNIDELRLWRGVKDAASILRNMNRSISTQSPNLEAYWRMDEGKGNKIFDFASRKHSGTVTGPITFQDDRAPIRNTTFTDNTGYYIAEGINYGTSTNFTVYPSRPGRIFTPENRLITLSTSNTAVNNIDFTDISQIAVSGRITNSADPTCLNDTTIEILVDDSSWTPRTYANSSGEYIIEFEPGATHKVSPSRKGYVFTPGFLQVDSIRAPLAQKNFAQMKTYNLTVKVAGGQCELALGGTTRVKVTPLPACGDFSVTKDITSGTTAVFNGLGPSIYKIEVTRPAGDIVFEADTVDMRDTSRIKKMIYYAPLQVVVSNLTPAVTTTCPPENVPILEQLKKYRLTYKAVEIYNGVECVIKGSKFIVTNEVADADSLIILLAPNGTIVDTFYAGLPNILAGGARPYQKQILLRAVDSLGRESQPFSYWALVTGVKPRQGNTFATTSPQLPLAILRSPPGDLSFSYLSQSSILANEISVGSFSTDGSVKNSMFSILPTVEIGLGKGFVQTTITTASILQKYSNVTISHSNTKTSQLRTTLQLNETVSTQNVGQTSGFKGDVIFGVSYNIVYGITDSIKWDAAACSVKASAGVSIAPDSIRTKFFYTEEYIRNTHIPNLYFLHTKRDSLHAKNWVNFLKYNDSLKLKAVDSLQNISFSAGAVYSYSKSYTRDSVLKFSDTFDTLKSNGTIGGLLVNNAGFTLDNGTVDYNIGLRDSTFSYSSTNTTGFTLADDDNGDGFTVNIAQDKVFGSPVFRTVAGQSSCPYEPGTFERDKAVFTVKHVAATNVHPDSMVIWPIRLGNASSTDETRDYNLRVLNATNPNGLVIAVNGIIIQNGIQFTIPKGTIQTMLMVKRSANIYSYSDIKLVLSPACATPDQAASQSDTLTIDAINYLRPCSPVNITSPLDNWLVNYFSDNRLGVTIAGYDTTNSDFYQVKLQYRRMLGPSRPFGGFARYAIESIDGSELLPRINLAGYPVEEFPKRVDFNTFYANTLDSYDASKEDRFSLLTGPMYDNIYRDIVLKGYNTGNNKNVKNKGGFAKTQQSSSRDEGDGNSSIMPDNPENLWTNFKVLPKDSLSNSANPGYYNAVWLNSGLDEGQYEIRAITNCNGSSIEATSAILSGLIDKTGPLVQGMPLPTSGILTLSDQIGIIFNEDVLSSTAIKGNTVNLYYSSGPQAGQPLDFNFSCDGRSILITPNIADRFIENQTLRAVVKRIKDINGNPMRIPLGTAFIDSVSWEFVVQKSPVRWAGGDITITKYADESVQVTRELKNLSGFPVSYYLKNIPAWLGVSSISGTVPNQGNVPITFTFGTSIASGVYDFTVADSTIYGDQPLRVHLVNACRPPQYTVNPANFEHSMNIIGKLFIGNVPSEDVNDKVGVFVGQQQRGFANVQRLPDGEYRVFITVYSNQQYGEQLTMRVWDSTACNEYGQALESFTFAANSVIGTYHSPASITATIQTLQSYKFASGWTWISLNTSKPDMSVTAVLNGLHPSDGDVIKYRDKYAQFVPSANYWFGLLDSLKPGQGYLMRLAAKDSLTIAGTPVTPSSVKIKLDAGWNYLGYVPQSGMTVNSALSSLNPTVGDLVKSQFAFATYTSSSGWVGNLFTMEPRLGYFMKLARKDSLIYPNNPPAAAPIPAQQNEINPILAENPSWNVEVGNYQYTMSVIAELGPGIFDSVTENSAIGIFFNNECRGFAKPIYISAEHPKMFFLTVYSNAASGEQLSFRVYDAVSNRTVALNSGIAFTPDGIIGSVPDPYIVTGQPLDVRDGKVIPEEYELAQNYPNPFNPSTIISYALPKDGSVKLVIYNIMGEVVRVLADDEMSAGYYSVQWDGRNNSGSLLPSGVYLYSINSGEFSATKKLTLMK